ncbi:hypothetical protein GALMADRAFT_239719 [Galerina marginata CBS 339.88]|uniref:Nucleoporin Nup133/Nup155-like C-terminal domain-containing protein n=1 Tax=Galerina marginata (strain CBS 339.88) TaxID=685588 RepID=A0A067TRN6_GALM3|nr:hypothetical protein GALMADRAFT_239719 [Galerina marginata CBS 339.88]
MATFSPSPAPRRSSRLHQNRGSSPQRAQRRLAQTPTQVIRDGSSVASAMDIDERNSVMTDRTLSRMGGDMLFAKTDEMSVLFYANLPLEVKQVLRISDFNVDPYSGQIDIVTGFALVTSVQTCFVWQHAQAIKGIPTCYIFSCPYDPRTPRPPFHALAPQGPSREPGLILVSTSGQIRFWDSIGIGLAGGDNYVSYQLDDMEYDEEVTNLVRSDAQTYILSTSYGKLYRVVLTSVGGKYHLTIRAFARPSSTGGFSRFVSFLSATPSSYEVKDKSKHIHAVSLGHKSHSGDQDVWALANGHIQHWSMKSEGWEELISDIDLTLLLAEAIQRKFDPKGQNLENSYQDIELSDLAVFDDQNIAILVSYPGKDEEDTDDFRRLYSLAELEVVGANYQVKHLNSVPYQTTSKPGPAVHPRVQLIYGGFIISVQFGDAVALCARGSEYSDRLELKSTNDRTLGVGVSPSTNLLLLLTASTMMKVSLDLEKIQAFMPETGHTNLVKSIMMQAILYGSSPLNPLRFSFPPALNEEALMQAAQQLSEAVLKSDPEVVRQSPDMTAQMTGRKERLSWLIGFINENGVLVKMSQSSRQKLATDAEKLYACHQLWLSYNQFLSTSPSQSALKDAIMSYMEEIRDGPHQDVVRVFFRSRVAEIGKVLTKVLAVVKAASTTTGGNTNASLPEANRIVVTVLRSAFQYRNYNLKVYGIQLPMTKPWSSRSSIIDTVLSLFESTTKVVESTPAFASRGKDQEPSSQLPSLASVLLESIKERLDWLSRAGTDYQRDMEELQQRFSVLRPEILETLRRCGHEDAAFTLAEQYHDYASLVALCHRDTVYPPEQNPNADRVQSYIQRYKEDFANELFHWYIQHGEIRTMFDQEAPGTAYVDVFFREHPNIAISWINDLGKSRFGSAASALLEDAENATNLEAKHLMLSIGKLSHLAQMQETNVSDESTLDAFHDGLDLVSVHESLVEEFRSVLVSVRTRQSIEGQIETIIKSKGGKLGGKTAFIHIFKDILRQLLQGRALSIEDLVDILSLKDNAESVEDYATSLHLLSSATNLPEARQNSALRTVWRRVYLHDDWDSLKETADISDDELNARYQGTALYATLCSVMHRSEFGLDPAEALMIPSTEEIVSRWPGMSTDQVDSMIRDYNSEQDRLGEWELDGVFGRIKELAEAEVTREQSQ